MSDRFSQNAAILLDAGAVAEASLDEGNPGRHLQLSNLDRHTALYLAGCLTKELDIRYTTIDPHYYIGRNSEYPNMTYQDVLGRATRQEQAGHSNIFGETRPANSNCAVRVEERTASYYDNYRLYADIRNRLADHPELQGGKFLQAGFIAVMSVVDLSDPGSWR